MWSVKKLIGIIVLVVAIEIIVSIFGGQIPYFGTFRIGVLSFFAAVQILVATLGVFLIIYFGLAPLNLWFTFVKEGTAKNIVKGDAVVKALIQWKGYTLDKNWNVIPEDKENKEHRHLFGGLRFYGFWPIHDVGTYNFEWKGLTIDGTVQKHPKETLDYVILRPDVYLADLLDAEDVDKVPLEIRLLFTISVINPKKAIYDVENWLETVINRSLTLVREVIPQKSYQDWNKNRKALEEIIMTELQIKHDKIFKNDYGINVQAIEVRNLDPAKDYREATTKKFRAEMDKEATIITAQAEKRKIEIGAKAEKNRIKAVYRAIEDFGDLGKLIRVCESVEKSPLAASLTVQAIPGIQEVFKGVFKKPIEEITPEEIGELKRILQNEQARKKRKRRK